MKNNIQKLLMVFLNLFVMYAFLFFNNFNLEDITLNDII